jgi:hypothetical protein
MMRADRLERDIVLGMEPVSEPTELELVSQGINDKGIAKIIVEIYRHGTGYRVRVPDYFDPGETGTDSTDWWGGLYESEEEATKQGCIRAGFSREFLVWECRESGKKRPYPPE